MRAYASNIGGTGYGQIISFTTDSCPDAPTVSSATPTLLYSGLGGGSSSFTAPVFARGYEPAGSSAVRAAISLNLPAGASLSPGSSGPSVRAVQQVLNSLGFTVASSGPGSPGHENSSFGALTKKAVQAFQRAYGIAKAGDPGYGTVGPRTLAKLKELGSKQSRNFSSAAPSSQDSQSAGKTASVPVAAISAIRVGLGQGSQGSSVQSLQVALNSLGFVISSSGPGSPGNETTSFGPSTVRAVQAFQKAYGIAKVGDSGYGTVGPKTLAKLKEVAASLQRSSVMIKKPP